MSQLKSFLFSAAGGLALLAGVNAAAVYTGAALGWSAFTIAVSTVFGLPGAAALLLLRALL